MKLVTALYLVSGNVVGQELERYETTQLDVLGLVNDAHIAAELFDNAVARNCLADHWRESYEQEKDSHSRESTSFPDWIGGSVWGSNPPVTSWMPPTGFEDHTECSDRL